MDILNAAERARITWGTLSCTKLTITKGAKLLTEPYQLPKSFTSGESVDFVRFVVFYSLCQRTEGHCGNQQ